MMFLSKKYNIENIENKNDMVEVIQNITNAINSRKNGSINKNFFSDEKYQKQILPLNNALSYANYINHKFLIKK